MAQRWNDIIDSSPWTELRPGFSQGTSVHHAQYGVQEDKPEGRRSGLTQVRNVMFANLTASAHQYRVHLADAPSTWTTQHASLFPEGCKRPIMILMIWSPSCPAQCTIPVYESERISLVGYWQHPQKNGRPNYDLHTVTCTVISTSTLTALALDNVQVLTEWS